MATKTLSPQIIGLLLPRLSDEFNAFYFYRALSNWCQANGFKIAASYFAKESEDELVHAKKIEDFLNLWNVIPELPSIPKPIYEFTNLADGIFKAYDKEAELYENYESDSNKALEIGDTCVFDFLQFFRNQQVTSVGEYSDMKNILEGIKFGDKFQMLQLEETLFGD